ncbi:hypothetical protein BT96DRAFT_945556 [Gymnopus androsaceus JB14]|uniref:Uncharacterized protein n=1 Tax=Gymnopus androsaceus JB14 TaxID=1447944 RepID=A0A6A4H1I9_9AGAR|nr:hypothetical protein BT96DRAFT_945556 [Gymnopus androsaceus JB14]
MPETSNTPICLSPHAHCGSTWPSSTEGERDGSRDKSRRHRVTIEEVSDEEMEERVSQKRGRESDDKWTHRPHLHHAHSVGDGAHEKHWMKIPLKMWYTSGPIVLHVLAENDVLVQVDACYTQKYSSKTGCDPPQIHLNTFFIPEAEVRAWKQRVDSVCQ